MIIRNVGERAITLRVKVWAGTVTTAVTLKEGERRKVARVYVPQGVEVVRRDGKEIDLKA